MKINYDIFLPGMDVAKLQPMEKQEMLHEEDDR